MKRLILLFTLFVTLKSYGQCSFTISTTFTPTSCSSCCDGIISANFSGPGTPCVPYGWQLNPGGIGSPSGTWSNLCAGNYTVSLVTGCCTMYGVCGLLSTNIQTLNSINLIKIFPNPTSDFIYFSNTDFEFSTSYVEIVNLLGETVLRDSLKNEINISDLNKGCYILKVDTKKDYQYRYTFPVEGVL